MAGIGFELKRLFAQKSAAGYFRAYSYTAVVTCGPFVLMASMLFIIQQLFKYFGVSYAQTQLYVVSIIYPFVFSHIVSSGFSMIITRYIADCLYDEDYGAIVASLYGITAVTLTMGSLFGLLFCWLAELDGLLELFTYTYYLQMIVIWLQGIYLSALKDYKKIFYAYTTGAVISILGVLGVLHWQLMSPMLGSMLAMNIGAVTMNAMLLAEIKNFFPHENYRTFYFIKYFESHGILFFVQLFYTVGIYIANILIWFSPMGVTIYNTYRYAAPYDTTTFYAFLSIMPVLIMFIVSVEVNFYERYEVYFMYITEKGNLSDIDEARKDLLRTMWSELRHIIELQLVFTLAFLALGNYLLPKVGLSYNSINIYTLLVLGAYAISLMQVIVTLLLYFEDRRGALVVCSIFLLLNIVFNIASLYMGENTYGFGFFLAAFIGLVVAIIRLNYFSKHIDYFVFCSRPIFYRYNQGLLHKLTSRMYPD